MTARRFVDTNIPLYAISARPEDLAKAAIARDILQADDIGTSVQVLQEFYTQATHRARHDRIPHEQAIRFIRALSEIPVQDITVELFHSAAQTKHRFGISYWDAAIIEGARSLGCELILARI